MSAVEVGGYRLPTGDAVAMLEPGATVWDVYAGASYSFVVGEVVGLSVDSVSVRIAGSSVVVDLARMGGGWSAAPFVSIAGICAPESSGTCLTGNVIRPRVSGMATTASTPLPTATAVRASYVGRTTCETCGRRFHRSAPLGPRHVCSDCY